MSNRQYSVPQASTPGSGGGGLTTATSNLTASSILTLGSVPVTVVPAIAGSVNIPIFASVQMNANTTNYTGSNTLLLTYSNNSVQGTSLGLNATLNTLVTTDLTGSIKSVYAVFPPHATSLNLNDHVAGSSNIVLTTGSGADFATGDHTMVVTVLYYTLTMV